MSAPNLLLVMADQLAAGALPAYGNRAVVAPHLDRLGREGVVFEQAYCASPLCTPSRASLLTGQLPSRTGAYDNAAGFAPETPTVAHYLRLAGYETCLAGKMHLIGPDQLHGFERRLTADVYPAGLDWTPDWERPADERFAWYHDMGSVRRAGPATATLQLDYDEEVAFRAERELLRLARAPRERPFFLVASFTHPHDPYEPPRACWDRYDGAAIPPPAVGPLPDEAHDAHSRRLLAMCQVEPEDGDPVRVERARRAYLAAVSYVDDQVGRLLRTLAATGLDRDTVVVVTSDHGDLLGERGLWYKMSFLEGSARVPLLVHAPGRLAARRVAQPVSLLDLLPTLVELGAGPDAFEPADPLDGTSLVPLLHGRAGGPREVLGEYLAEGTTQPLVMLRRGALKYVHCPGDPDLLYDLDADPHELAPLSAGTEAFRAEVEQRCDLPALRARVVASQRRRALAARALALGETTSWDWRPPPDGAGTIGSGQDFWQTLERARLPEP